MQQIPTAMRRISLERFVELINQRMTEYPECEGIRLNYWEPKCSEAHFSGPKSDACIRTVDRIIRELRAEYSVQGDTAE